MRTGLPADVELPPSTETLRAEIRGFLENQLSQGTFVPSVDTWMSGFDAEFSRKLGALGWIGMTWPSKYGGSQRTALERFIVIEELLAAGAPVAAHWFADRQVGPSLLRYGTEEQREELLPRMARGECFFAIGMSEPDAGSDLASVRTRARQVAGGWQIDGRKVWTTAAHRANFIVVLCRTSERSDDPRKGLSQFIVDLPTPGVEVRPIVGMGGDHHFNEVLFDGVVVSDASVLGSIGQGWQQVTSELTHERSGPERYMSTLALLVEFMRSGINPADTHIITALGRLVAELWSLRTLSIQVAAALDAGKDPRVAAAVVKDLGTRLEGEIVDVVRSSSASGSPTTRLNELLDIAMLRAPGFTLRGGTTEILRSIIAKDLCS